VIVVICNCAEPTDRLLKKKRDCLSVSPSSGETRARLHDIREVQAAVWS
jgi:hypothetical protein